MTRQADLAAYVMEGQRQHGGAQLSSTLLQWMDASPRFTTFVDTYRDKIRKKVRVIREQESMLDVRSELEVAYGLLNDRRLSVVYEPNASAKRRGPDFAVTYRDNLTFNIEVARIRAAGAEGEEHSLEHTDERLRKETRFLRVLLNKLGQMQPGMPNMLVIHTHPALARLFDLNRLMQSVKTRVESKDPAFYALSRYTSPADFYKDFLLLSGILVWVASEGGPAPTSLVPAMLVPTMLANILWVNKQARPGLAENVLRVVALASLPPGAGELSGEG